MELIRTVSKESIKFQCCCFGFTVSLNPHGELLRDAVRQSDSEGPFLYAGIKDKTTSQSATIACTVLVLIVRLKSVSCEHNFNPAYQLH